MAWVITDSELRRRMDKCEKEWSERIATRRRDLVERPFRQAPVCAPYSAMMEGAAPKFQSRNKQLGPFGELRDKEKDSFDGTLEYIKYRIAYNS